MNTPNAIPKDDRTGLDCRCGKEYRPIFQNTNILRCLVCGRVIVAEAAKAAA